MAIHAGELQHRITIEANNPTRSDDFNVPVERWTVYASRWAKVMPLTGRELWSAQQVNAEITHRIKLRWVEGVTPAMRIKFRQRTFQILAVLNLEEQDTELQIDCRELV